MLPNPEDLVPDEVGGICRRFLAVFVPMKRDIAIAFEDVGVWTQPVMYELIGAENLSRLHQAFKLLSKRRKPNSALLVVTVRVIDTNHTWLHMP